MHYGNMVRIFSLYLEGRAGVREEGMFMDGSPEAVITQYVSLPSDFVYSHLGSSLFKKCNRHERRLCLCPVTHASRSLKGDRVYKISSYPHLIGFSFSSLSTCPNILEDRVKTVVTWRWHGMGVGSEERERNTEE